MGERGVANEDATTDDIAEMARHVREAIQAGAVGFSSSRSLNHKDLDGELVPGTFASVDELVGLAQAVVDAGGGLFEVVPQGETEGDADLILSEIELMGTVSQATGVPLSFLLVQSRLDPDLWRRQLELVEKINANGAHVDAQVAARPGGMLIGAASYHPLVRRPTYRRLEDTLSLDDLLVELQKPEVKATILARRNLRPTRTGSTSRSPTTRPTCGAASSRSATRPTTSPSPSGRSRASRPRPDAIRSRCSTTTSPPVSSCSAVTNYAQGNEDHLAEMIADPNTMIGLSDGGAHVKMICDVRRSRTCSRTGCATAAAAYVSRWRSWCKAGGRHGGDVGLDDRGRSRRARRPT